MNILVAGDLCIRGKGEEFAEPQKAKELLGEVANRVAKADLSMINVETVFTDIESPIPKSGPALTSSVASLEMLKVLGFDIAAYANNHTFDHGAEAMYASMEKIRGLGMYVIGAGENAAAAAKPLYLERCGKKIAVLNFCEHEFGFSERERPGTAGLDIYENSKLIKEAKENADIVIVYIHAGCEFLPIPRPGLINLCRAFVDAGATAVITAHSHCPVGCEVYNGVPICYGLGNFYMPKSTFNITGSFWTVGYMADLEITDSGVTLTPVPYIFGEDGEYMRLLSDDEHRLFTEYHDKISSIIHDKPLYEKLWKAWCDIYMHGDARGNISKFNIENPFDDEFVLFMRNSYTCESHVEVLKTYYTDYCNREPAEEKYIDMINSLRKKPF